MVCSVMIPASAGWRSSTRVGQKTCDPFGLRPRQSQADGSRGRDLTQSHRFSVGFPWRTDAIALRRGQMPSF